MTGHFKHRVVPLQMSNCSARAASESLVMSGPLGVFTHYFIKLECKNIQ